METPHSSSSGSYIPLSVLPCPDLKEITARRHKVVLSPGEYHRLELEVKNMKVAVLRCMLHPETLEGVVQEFLTKHPTATIVSMSQVTLAGLSDVWTTIIYREAE